MTRRLSLPSHPDVPPAARAIADALGDDRVSTAVDERRTLERDMGDAPPELTSRLGVAMPRFAVRPRNTDEVSKALEVLRREGVPVTPRGLGSTGLGGAVPVAGGAVLDLSRLAGVLDVDDERRVATVRAGTTFFYVQRELERARLQLASRPTNGFGTIGGWASAGGLGLGSTRAGALKERVEAIEVALPDGRVERLTRTDTGFDDFFDSEGQLGVITNLTLELDRSDSRTRVFGRLFEDLGAALSWVGALVEGGVEIRNAVLAGRASELGAAQDGGDGEVVLVEVSGESAAGEPADDANRALPADVVNRLWSHRFFPMDHPTGPVYLASEAILPLDGAAGWVDAARRLAARFHVHLSAHSYVVKCAGEHRVLVLLQYPTNPRLHRRHLMLASLAPMLTRLAVRKGGRPYGVGIWNTPFAEQAVGADRLDHLRQRKRQLDPVGLLNAGKFFRVGAEPRLLSTLMKPRAFRTLVGLARVGAPLLAGHDRPSESDAHPMYRCVSCGACVPVCPAVIATGEESLSGRAKLALMRRLASGETPPQQELMASLRCLECGQCAEVCARGLDLVGAWRELDAIVLERVPDLMARGKVLADFAERVDRMRREVLERTLP